MKHRSIKLAVCLILFVSCFLAMQSPRTHASGSQDGQINPLSPGDGDSDAELDKNLQLLLKSNGFTGNIESTLEKRLGRKINKKLANVGRLLFFDIIGGLKGDNTCAGCHSPSNGFGDTQPIAIGIDNNFFVGRNRLGPRNQRRTPMVLDSAFYPALMWNGRFNSSSMDPFNNTQGFNFPMPEGRMLSNQPHLLTAQAFIPPTERTEAAGFDFPGDNFDLRKEVIRILNTVDAYKPLFGKIFPEVKQGQPITYDMFAKAISEFEFTLVAANAPLDQYARGAKKALTDEQKRGAVLFFGKAGCVNCHSVSGSSNEMFSDFKNHNIGIPQIVPIQSNVTFDGPGQNEDFGAEQISGNPDDRYKFRTAPLRNLAVQPFFFHNGSFSTIESAVKHHLDVFTSARNFKNNTANLPADLTAPLAPIEPVLAKVDPLLSKPIQLTDEEFENLVDFIRNGLLDPKAKPENLRKLIPDSVPSGKRTLFFE